MVTAAIDSHSHVGEVLRLPAELTIYTVGELHPQWLAWLQQLGQVSDSPAACALDASAVEQVDAAGVQLLVSLHGALQRCGSGLQIEQPAPALIEACAAIGLEGWARKLSSPVVASATEFAA